MYHFFTALKMYICCWTTMLKCCTAPSAYILDLKNSVHRENHLFRTCSCLVTKDQINHHLPLALYCGSLRIPSLTRAILRLIASFIFHFLYTVFQCELHLARLEYLYRCSTLIPSSVGVCEIMAKQRCVECKQEINNLEPILCGFCEASFHIQCVV